MKYLSKVEQTYTPVNNLEKAVLKYFLSIDRVLVPGYRIATVVQEITNDVKAIAHNHPKCKPIVLDWYSDDQKKDICVHVSKVCQFSLLHVTREGITC